MLTPSMFSAQRGLIEHLRGSSFRSGSVLPRHSWFHRGDKTSHLVCLCQSSSTLCSILTSLEEVCKLRKSSPRPLVHRSSTPICKQGNRLVHRPTMRKSSLLMAQWIHLPRRCMPVKAEPEERWEAAAWVSCSRQSLVVRRSTACRGLIRVSSSAASSTSGVPAIDPTARPRRRWRSNDRPQKRRPGCRRCGAVRSGRFAVFLAPCRVCCWGARLISSSSTAYTFYLRLGAVIGRASSSSARARDSRRPREARRHELLKTVSVSFTVLYHPSAPLLSETERRQQSNVYREGFAGLNR